MALGDVAAIEDVDLDIGRLYADYRLATLTGWTLEYIAGLSILQTSAMLQMWEAEQALKTPRKR